MRNSKRQAPTVNAGSMADIAFLLLIFFLVTTTISADKGILRKLPKKCDSPECITDINERNVLRILINTDNEIMVEDEVIELIALKDLVKNFIDNNGQNVCDYCNGNQLPTSSDQPSEAVISLKYDAFSNYAAFINVQDKISEAFLELRTVYAEHTFDKTPETLTKEELHLVKKAYPFALSEVSIKRN